MALKVIAAYDVREDDRRARLAATLQVHGTRVQKSVFVLALDGDELAGLIERCEFVIDPRTDALWFARQCEGCWGKAVTLGQSVLAPPVMFWAAL